MKLKYINMQMFLKYILMKKNINMKKKSEKTIYIIIIYLIII